MPGEQRGGGVRHAHRHAWMAAVGGFDRIHRQGANGIGESALGWHEISMGRPGGGIRLADGLVPIVVARRGVNLGRHARLRTLPFCYAFSTMSNTPLEEAMDRAERALLRIERAVERGAMHEGRDDKLRAKVADAMARA